MKQVFLTVLLCCFNYLSLLAQNTYELMNTTVTENGQTLRFPFVGGGDRVQFNDADLNNDGIADLVVFDRLDEKIMTFINGGTPNTFDYMYAPNYETNFPPIGLWMDLLDFDCDGITDMFAGLNNGLEFYKGSYNANNELTFQLVQSGLTYLPNNFNIDVIYEDIPTIGDINGDGDIDILTNNVNGGTWIYYFENQSQEQSLPCGSLVFDLVTDCWGDFVANLNLTYNFDTCFSTAPLAETDRQYTASQQANNEKGLHFQKNITLIDIDGDADQDLIIGPNNTGKLHLLTNDGTTTLADMNMADLDFLSYTQSVDINFQAKAFYIDINNDGKRDMTVGRSEDGICPLVGNNVAFYYENINTDASPTFNFIQDDFWVGDMIEVGRNAKPIFFDYNNDGLIDLLVSNYGYWSNTHNDHISQIAVYQNVGTATVPAFDLVQTDFGNMSFYQLQDLFPAFGDLDGDGDADMIAGEKDGNLFYFENTGGTYTLDILAFTDDIGQYSTPILYDFDQDGDLDLISSSSGSSMYYYRNTGTPSAFNFQLVTANLGAASQPSPYDYGVPFIADFGHDRLPHLFVSYNNNEVVAFTDFNPASPFSSFTQIAVPDLANIDFRQRGSIAAADLDNDGYLEFAIGNRRGGLGIYKNPCATPYLSTINNITTNSATISWQGNATNYEIEYRPVGTTTWNMLTSTNPTLTLSNLLNCTDYEIQIRTNCSPINSNFTPIRTFTTNSLSATWATTNLRACDPVLNLNTLITGDAGGVWSGGSYVSSTGMFDPTGLAVGTYSVTYSVGTPVCDVSTQSITILPDPNPNWSGAGSSWRACDGILDVSLLVTGDTGGTWSGGSYISASGIVNPTTLTSGSYPITYSVGTGSCNFTETHNLTILPDPNPNWTTTTWRACDGVLNTNTLITGDTGGVWSGGNYINSTGNFDPTGLGTGNYVVTYSVGSGSCNFSETHNITIQADPNPNWIATNWQECAGILNANTLITGDTGGTWSGGVYINSAGNFDPTGLAIGNYAVTYSVGTGSCNFTETHNITIIPDPNPNWTATNWRVCDGILDANTLVTGDVGGTWSGGAYINSTGNFNPTGLAIGNYAVTYSVGTGSCNFTETHNINLQSDPNPSWNSLNLQECDNAVDFNTLVTGDTGGIWTGGGYINSAGIFTPTGLSAGNYGVTYTVGTGTCAFSQTHLITVSAAPNPNWTTGSIPQCGGLTDLTPTISGTMGGTWSGGAYINSAGIFDPTGLTPNSYSVTYSVGTGSCLTSSTQNVVITASTSANWTPTNISECDNPMNLNGLITGTVGGTWSGGGYISSAGIFDPAGLTPNTYVVTYTVGSGSCSAMQTQNIIVTAATTNATWTPISLQECDVPADLNTLVTGTTGGVWSGGSYVNASGTFTPTGLTTGSYSVTYSVGQGSCSFTETHNITIQNNPSAAWTITSLPSCANPLDLNTLITGDMGGTWSGGSYVATSGMFDPTGLAVGTYSVTYSVGTGSCTDFVTQNITISPLPNASWQPTITSACAGTTDLNTLVTGDTGGTWSGGNYVSTSGIFDPSGLFFGTYPVTYSVGMGGCLTQFSQNILVAAPPSANWSSPSLENCADPLDLNTLVTGTPNGLWSGGSYVSNSGIFNPNSLPAGIYPVTYTVGTGSCANALTRNVVIEDCATFRVKVLLEGVYNSSGQMNNTLLPIFPYTQTYNIPPYNYAGTENISSLPPNVVDWILLEARDVGNNYMVVETRVALLLDDGNVVPPDGSLHGVRFNNLTVGNNYYLAIRHRNHVDVMSSVALPFPNVTLYDFTTNSTQALGKQQMKEVDTGIFALWAGDVNSDGIISVQDYNEYKTQLSISGLYMDEDVNLDQNVTVSDFNMYRPNASIIGIPQIRY